MLEKYDLYRVDNGYGDEFLATYQLFPPVIGEIIHFDKPYRIVKIEGKDVYLDSLIDKPTVLFNEVKGLIESWKRQNEYDCPFDYDTLLYKIKMYVK